VTSSSADDLALELNAWFTIKLFLCDRHTETHFMVLVHTCYHMCDNNSVPAARSRCDVSVVGQQLFVGCCIRSGQRIFERS
jgi:hypothetical protein